MKHYITISRTQKLIYCIDAKNKFEAKEKALELATVESIPLDIEDAEFQVDVCITQPEFFQLSKIIDS